MKRAWAFLALTVLPACMAFAAEHGAEGGEPRGHVELWKSINFVILVAGLVWLSKKYVTPYFRARSEEIRNGIAEARRISEEAGERVASMDRKLADLESELADLRAQAGREMEAEQARRKGQTEQMIARLRSNARQEIESAAKHARKQLRAYSSELAIELARNKVRERMNPELAGKLMDSFVSGLRRVN